MAHALFHTRCATQSLRDPVQRMYRSAADTSSLDDGLLTCASRLSLQGIASTHICNCP